MTDPFLAAVDQLNTLATLLGLPPDTVSILSTPERVLTVTIPVQMDDGRIRLFVGYRSQHNHARGPYKGGIRFHPRVSLSEVQALSMWMTWKCAIADIPYGGGKGGVIVDPKQLSIRELEQLSRGYVRAIGDIIGEDVDIPAPDVNTDGRIMGWMRDEYEQLIGRSAPATFTGKSLQEGGSEGRTEATGYGGVYVLNRLFAKKDTPIAGKRIAVQGIGNVGSYFAKKAHAQGYKIVALSDSKTALFDPKGLVPDDVFAYKQRHSTLAGYNAQQIPLDALLTLDVDVLVPAALEHVITAENADAIQAPIIVEMANGPTTPEADEMLTKRGVSIIPDVLANSGGVTVSYFEWVQNKTDAHWSKKKVLSQLEQTITTAFDHCYDSMIKLKTTMRMGSYAVAVQKVVAAMKILG